MKRTKIERDGCQATSPLPQAGGVGGGLPRREAGHGIRRRPDPVRLRRGGRQQQPARTPAAAPTPNSPGCNISTARPKPTRSRGKPGTALVTYAADRVRRPQADSVVLAQGSSLESPRFIPCAGKRPAAVFDVDETVLQNLGFEYDDLTGRADRDFSAAGAPGSRATAIRPAHPRAGRSAMPILRTMACVWGGRDGDLQHQSRRSRRGGARD